MAQRGMLSLLGYPCHTTHPSCFGMKDCLHQAHPQLPLLLGAKQQSKPGPVCHLLLTKLLAITETEPAL